MKAVRIDEYGTVDVLNYTEYPTPKVGFNDILVKVKATSVSGFDIKYRNGSLSKVMAEKGLPGRKMFPLPQQLGRECTGIVEQIGKGISQFAVGDRVMGLVHPVNPYCKNTIRGLGNLSTEIDYPGHAGLGGNAEYVARPEHYWMKLPDNVSFEKAAAGSWSYPTAHRIVFDRFKVQAGDTILVTGITGGMGYATMEWARLAGAKIIGTTRKDTNTPELLAMNLDLLVNTNDLEKAKNEILAFTHGDGVDHYVEFTGSRALFSLALDVIREGGNFCPVGGDQNLSPLPISVIDFTRKELNMLGIRGSNLIDQKKYIEHLSDQKIDPIISKTMPLSSIREAHSLIEQSKVIGKIVLIP